MSSAKVVSCIFEGVDREWGYGDKWGRRGSGDRGGGIEGGKSGKILAGK